MSTTSVAGGERGSAPASSLAAALRGAVAASHREWVLALVAALGVLPAFAGAATMAVFLARWPSSDGSAQVGAGVAIGLAAWVAASLVFFRGSGQVESADSASYGELCSRLTTLTARVEALRRLHEQGAIVPWEVAQEEALAEADAQVKELARILRPRAPEELLASRLNRSWLQGSGYITLWRRIHRAEEALLEVEPVEALYAALLRDRARLTRSTIPDRDRLIDELNAYLPGPTDGEAGAPKAVALRSERGRALLREVRFTLDTYRNDLWDRLVHQRVLVTATLVFTGLTTYLLLALAVAAGAQTDGVVAAGAFYLVGALVGLFAELYGASRSGESRGYVHDYGLGHARLLTTPVLSGIAALGGVLLSNAVGPQLLFQPESAAFKLEQIFDLGAYPAGLVIAAIFGLTPGLLLERIRAATEQYKSEIASTTVAGDRQADDGPGS